ncbi:uncharacterized protein N7479_005502 [Penicillium vulpinum]|uniref:PEBP-like protein n=1 Tax=Penicillium vulpinum TaxID=29845 RepID=A0A1V6SEE1_9EURO|nr:uncharacterized protein N7479_005502 [Penicillium vulpinum]KAJ5958352.1 hypothetical protein N7479_005502 [Penicillium vulpinum]OQE12365.1 hypothetical protein PENVUL_c001G01855 [Penicillium vulpinum]
MPSDNHIKAAMSLIEDKSKVLGLTIGIHENVQPGTWLPRKSAQKPPKLFFAGANPTTTYLVVSLDIDAPFPAFTILSPILHWIQSDIQLIGNAALAFDAPFVANYIGPAPPPASAPHRYLFLLYEQPEGFDLTAHAPVAGRTVSNSNRMRYDLDAWAEKVNLGLPVAFNYFTCN